MSELKAFNCVDSDLQEFCEPRLVYLKFVLTKQDGTEQVWEAK